jgi:pilus assembly protein Flp/PilA
MSPSGSNVKPLINKDYPSGDVWVLKLPYLLRPKLGTKIGEQEMNKLMTKLYLTFQALREEHGQDLIEYVLIGGIVALGAVAGMSTFATDVNTAFSNLGAKLTSYAS